MFIAALVIYIGIDTYAQYSLSILSEHPNTEKLKTLSRVSRVYITAYVLTLPLAPTLHDFADTVYTVLCLLAWEYIKTLLVAQLATLSQKYEDYAPGSAE